MQAKYIILISLLCLMTILAHSQSPLLQRKLWKGRFDITMTSNTNLEAVYLDSTVAKKRILKPDSLILYETMIMSGDLLSSNNRYKGKIPFEKKRIPLPAIKCQDPEMACYDGFLKRSTSDCWNELYTDRYIAMTYTDYDTNTATYSSSMGAISIPPDAKVEAAYLYWTGCFSENNPISFFTPSKSYTGTGNIFNLNISDTTYKKVLLSVPGRPYEKITAETIFFQDNDGYLCKSDVTQLLKDAKSGSYWVANIPTYPIQSLAGSSSGWTLVVITSSANYPLSAISLLDGWLQLRDGEVRDFKINFELPSAKTYAAFLGVGLTDGANFASVVYPHQEDLGFKFGNNTLQYINPFKTDQPYYKLWTDDGYPSDRGSDNDICGKPLFDSAWTSSYDGFASSKITAYDSKTGKNGNEIIRLPDHRNTLGIDAHYLKIPGYTSNVSDATVRISAGSEGNTSPYLLFLALREDAQLGLGDSFNSEEVITISPNPLADKSLITNHATLQGELVVQIHNMDGTMVYSAPYYQGMELERNSFKTGLYLLRIKDETGKSFLKKANG